MNRLLYTIICGAFVIAILIGFYYLCIWQHFGLPVFAMAVCAAHVMNHIRTAWKDYDEFERGERGLW